MTEYRIGAFKFMELTLYFAKLPFGGEIVEVGPEGLGRVMAAIDKQFMDHHHTIYTIEMQAFLREYAGKLRHFADRLAAGNKLMFSLNQEKFRKAEVISISENLVESYDDELELETALSPPEGELPLVSTF